MKNMENEMIGELIREITESGFPNLGIEVDDTSPARSVRVTADCADWITQTGGSGANMIEALEDTVNAIREILGKPTLDEEVANMIAEQEQHAKTLIQCGPGAKCPCGSPFLIVERKPVFEMAVDLQTGEVCFTEQPKPFTVENGEIARCPSCKNWFQLTA